MEDWFSGDYEGLLRYCTAMTDDWAGAEDLVQETFLRALTHLDDLEGLEAGQRRAWLRKTARNLFIDKCRKEARETPAEEEQLALTAVEEDFTAAEVAELLGRLPEEERALFTLRYFQGYNATELGRMFSLPPGTVRSKLSDARKRIRKLLSL